MLSDLTKLRGAMGGGEEDQQQQQHTPIEANDTLQSRAYARVLHLLSEGPVSGLVNGYSSIYFNGTPLFSSDGSLNFQGTNVLFNAGHPHLVQNYFPGFAEVESEINVETEVTLATPVVRTITNLDADAVRVRVAVPGLQTTDTTTGDINGASIPLVVELKRFGGSWAQVISETISGKTSARYEKQYRVQLVGTGPWDIRVRRTNTESSSQFVSDRLFFSAFTELVEEKLTYPHSAICGVTFESTQFRQPPTLGFELRGKLVLVPNNYNPETRVYSGIWNGTLVQAYSNNPAWCFYDLLSNNRYGIGDLINASAIDTAALYALGQYCDELVPDGNGGYEPRYTLNVYIQTQADAWKVLSNIMSICNGMIYGGDGGGVTVVADRPSDPVIQYSEANVIRADGGHYFEYSGSGRDARHNAAVVTWNDPANGYRQALEPYTDDEAVVAQGYRELQFAPFGCTSQGQALRAAKWSIATEQRETDTITFGVGLDSALVRPGNVFRVQDPKRTGKRFAGRLIGAQTTTLLAIDAPITIESGKTYEAAIMLATGALSDWVTVTNSAGATSSLSLAAALPATPAEHAIWMVQANDLSASLWRCLSLQEDGRGAFQVTGISHDPTKQTFVETGIQLPTPPTNTLFSPNAVTGLSLQEALVLGTGGAICQVTVTWNPIARANGYQYRWRRDSTAWVSWIHTTSTGFELVGALAGTYDVQVYATNLISNGQPASLSQYVAGLGALPADIPWFLVSGDVLSWGHVTDLDVIVGGGYEIRYQSGSNVNWGTASYLFSGILTSSPATIPFELSGVHTFLIKAVDSSGNYSRSPMTIVRGLGDPVLRNAVEVQDLRAQAWPGSIVGGTIISGNIDANNIAAWYRPDEATWYAGSAEDWYGNNFEALTYTTNTLTLAERKVGATIYLETDIVGDSVAVSFKAAGYEPWYRPESETWFAPDDEPWFGWGETDWQPIVAGQELLDAHYLFRVQTSATQVQGRISQFKCIIDYPDIIEYFEDLLVPNIGVRLPIQRAYLAIKNVQLTLQSNGTTARTVEYVDKEAIAGPLVRVFDSSHNMVGGAKVDARIVGY